MFAFLLSRYVRSALQSGTRVPIFAQSNLVLSALRAHRASRGFWDPQTYVHVLQRGQSRSSPSPGLPTRVRGHGHHQIPFSKCFGVVPSALAKLSTSSRMTRWRPASMFTTDVRVRPTRLAKSP